MNTFTYRGDIIIFFKTKRNVNENKLSIIKQYIENECRTVISNEYCVMTKVSFKKALFN